MPDHELLRILGEIQRRGAIGPVDLTSAVAHADGFVAAIPESARTAIDLGSGGGLPGLVIGVRLPLLSLQLVERRAKRADLLRFAVRALGLGDHVVVVEADAQLLADDVVATGGLVDVVTARSFAATEVLLPLATRLLRPGGVLVVSDPPSGHGKWTQTQLQDADLVDRGSKGGVHLLERLDVPRGTSGTPTV